MKKDHLRYASAEGCEDTTTFTAETWQEKNKWHLYSYDSFNGKKEYKIFLSETPDHYILARYRYGFATNAHRRIWAHEYKEGWNVPKYPDVYDFNPPSPESLALVEAFEATINLYDNEPVYTAPKPY